MTKSTTVLLGALLIAIVLLAHELDYREITRHEEQTVTYSHPQMQTPCREPAVNKELRIWIDKRISDKEGLRTCRVIPISGDDSPRKAMKSALKQVRL